MTLEAESYTLHKGNGRTPSRNTIIQILACKNPYINYGYIAIEMQMDWRSFNLRTPIVDLRHMPSGLSPVRPHKVTPEAYS